MYKNEKCTILDEVDEAMYLTSINDYELIFMNNHLKDMLHINGEEYIGKKCYEVIHNEMAPCEFCSSFNLNNKTFECKKRYIPRFDGIYNIKAKSIELYDEDVRLIITDDITKEETHKLDLDRKNKAEQSIINFISTLTNQKKIDTALDLVLEEITNYYQADRGYIFEINHEAKTVSNTHEYNREGVEPQIEMLQNLPLEIIDRWVEIFNAHKYIFIDSINKELDSNSDEYKILKEQDIERLLAVPFYVEGKLIGFIGIDNPKYDYKDTTLLKSISFFVFYDMTRRAQIKELEALSSYDTLTGLKNRNSYIYELEYLEKKKPNNIGIIYMDLNGLKQANDQYGHEYGDSKLKEAALVIRKFFNDNCYRVGGDEFVVILTNIDKSKFTERLNMLIDDIKHHESINISLGCIYEANPQEIETLVSKADKLMYEEKLKYYNKK